MSSKKIEKVDLHIDCSWRENLIMLFVIKIMNQKLHLILTGRVQIWEYLGKKWLIFYFNINYLISFQWKSSFFIFIIINFRFSSYLQFPWLIRKKIIFSQQHDSIYQTKPLEIDWHCIKAPILTLMGGMLPFSISDSFFHCHTGVT